MAVHITEADCEFGGSIADVAANLTGEVRDPLRWVSDMVAAKGSPERSAVLMQDLRLILGPVLLHGAELDDAVRGRCSDAYTAWLESL